jgi:hypothetical protein
MQTKIGKEVFVEKSFCLGFFCADQGCQIFLDAGYQNRKNVPNKLTMVIKYPKCP